MISNIIYSLAEEDKKPDRLNFMVPKDMLFKNYYNAALASAKKRKPPKTSQLRKTGFSKIYCNVALAS